MGKTIQIVIDLELYAAVSAFAQADNRTISNACRFLLTELLLPNGEELLIEEALEARTGKEAAVGA